MLSPEVIPYIYKTPDYERCADVESTENWYNVCNNSEALDLVCFTIS
jgi:hypothetical protein